jgi:hypothetical protein
MLPNTVNLAKTLSTYAAVCSPGLIPGTNPPDFLRLSVTSFVSTVRASQIKQNVMIRAEKVCMYQGCPGLSANEIVCKNPKDSACPNQVESEEGNS